MKKKSLEHLLQWSLILMLICLPNEPFLIAFAETGESELVQTLEESSLLEEIDTRSLLPQATFEFKQPRFSGTLGNPLLLELVSDLAVEEVVLELPPELEVLTEEQPSEKTVIKKDTNHWQIKTSQRQQSFAVPIIAKQTGRFVVTSGGAEALVEIKAANDSNLSTLTATNSDLAVWKNGSNLSGDPDLNFPTLDFAFSGTDFGTLGVTNQPDILNLETFGDKGLTNYSRVSSNNARWAIADVLRVPTNADKKIHGRVSIPVGFDGTRPAWDNEAKVTVEIETAAGHKERVTASTVGHTEENPGISIYGEEAQGGVFEISLAAPLEAGTTVRIVAVELTSGELTEGALNLILVGPVEVFPIIPPTPAVVSSLTLLEESTELHGYTEDREVQISATHNGVWFNTEMADIDENGRFIIDLSSRQLKDGDEIQVFLKDSVGSAKAAGVQHPPVTNDQTGNQNPPSELSFRDAVFPAATTVKIVKSGPFPPVDPLEPEMEVEPDNPPLLPDNQGMISLDFVSQFQFGQVPIRSTKGTYYALPQQISQEGTSDTADRPNYVQITDQRKLLAETSWRLSATFDSQGFRNEDNDHLIGAQINLHNQYLATASTNADANMPELAVADDGTITLLPGEGQLLLTGGSRSTGTWIYRFGDQETAATSVELEVPAGANPKTGRYRATIEWSLSSVPE